MQSGVAEKDLETIYGAADGKLSSSPFNRSLRDREIVINNR